MLRKASNNCFNIHLSRLGVFSDTLFGCGFTSTNVVEDSPPDGTLLPVLVAWVVVVVTL